MSKLFTKNSLRLSSMFRASLQLALLTSVVCGGNAATEAAVYTWNVAGGGDWNTASNWISVPVTGTAPPNGNHTVNINVSGGTITGDPAGGDDKWRFLNFDHGRIQDHDRANADNVGTWNIGDGNVGNGTATFAFGAGGVGPGTFRGGTFNVNADGIVTATNITMGHTSSNAPTTVNIHGGSITASGNLNWSNYQNTINLHGGSLAVSGNSNHTGAASSTFNIYGGSLTADVYTVTGWSAGKALNFNVTGDNASLIQFRQWNLTSNTGGTGDLSYTLVTGQTVTPISLTDAANVFANNAANFANNFTVRILGSGVDDTFNSDLVLFRLANANNFNGLSQLRFDDLLGNSFREEGDMISIAVNGGSRDFLLHFNSLRSGNLSGSLEIWLEHYIEPAPEPSSLWLLGLGAVVLRKRKQTRSQRTAC